MIFCYTYLTIIREASFCCKWEQIQGLRAKHYTGIEILKHTALYEMSLSGISPQSSGNSTEEGAEGVWDPEEMDATRRM